MEDLRDYFIIYTESQISSCCKSLYDANIRDGRSNLPLTKHKWENHNKMPGQNAPRTLQNTYWNSRTPDVDSIVGLRGLDVQFQNIMQRKAFYSQSVQTLHYPSFIPQNIKQTGGGGYLVEKVKKTNKQTNPHHEKIYQFKLNALFKLAKKSKKGALPFASSCQNIQNEVGRTCFLFILTNISIRYKITSKYKHTIWGWNNRHLNFILHV